MGDDDIAAMEMLLNAPISFSPNCRSGLLDKCECCRCRRERGEEATDETERVAARQAKDADEAFFQRTLQSFAVPAHLHGRDGR